MVRYVPEGTVEIALVTTASDYTAITAAECNAGLDVTTQMVGDIDLPFSGEVVDAADMSSRLNKTAPGDYGGTAGSFTIHKEKASGDDGAWTAFARDVIGYLVIAVRGLATPGTFAVADRVDVWPITVLSRSNQYARGTTLRTEIRVAITNDPAEDYAIAS